MEDSLEQRRKRHISNSIILHMTPYNSQLIVEENKNDRYVNMCLRMLYLSSRKFNRGQLTAKDLATRIPLFSTTPDLKVGDLIDKGKLLLQDKNPIPLLALTYYVAFRAAAIKDGREELHNWQLRKKGDMYFLLSDVHVYFSIDRFIKYEIWKDLVDDTDIVCSLEDFFPNTHDILLSPAMRRKTIVDDAGDYGDIVAKALLPGRDPRVPEPIPLSIETRILMSRTYDVIEKVLAANINIYCRDRRSFEDDSNFIFVE
jgi:hypothetical protein